MGNNYFQQIAQRSGGSDEIDHSRLSHLLPVKEQPFTGPEIGIKESQENTIYPSPENPGETHPLNIAADDIKKGAKADIQPERIKVRESYFEKQIQRSAIIDAENNNAGAQQNKIVTVITEKKDGAHPLDVIVPQIEKKPDTSVPLAEIKQMKPSPDPLRSEIIYPAYDKKKNTQTEVIKLMQPADPIIPNAITIRSLRAKEKKDESANKLVIGRIIVEVANKQAPVIKTKERVIVRNNTTIISKTSGGTNKLRFGLGQL